MARKVEVLIPLDPEIAATLTDGESRAAAGRLLSRLLKADMADDPLTAAMNRLASEAHANGLTPELLERELAKHKTERRH